MIELTVGFTITIISLLVGYSLGRHQRVIPEEARKAVIETVRKIQARRVLPVSEVGGVSRPDQSQLDRYNNPRLAEEEQIMTETIEGLNKNGQ